MSSVPSPKKVVLTPNAPQPIGPYSQAVACGGFLFCSGQLGLDSKTGALAQGVQAQTQQAMANIAAVLEAGGGSWAAVVKTTIFLKSMADFAQVNEIYAKSFEGTPPARSTVEVARLPKDGLVEIEVICCIG